MRQKHSDPETLWRKAGAWLLIAALLLSAAVLRAAFTSAYDQAVSARMAGAAGAWVAGPQGGDSALGNPAGLGFGLGPEILVTGGELDDSNLALGAIVLSLPYDAGLHFAISNGDLLQMGGSVYLENDSAISVDMLLAPGIDFGARYNYDHLSSPGGSNNGSSIDLGLRGDYLFLEGQKISLGAELDNIISSWDDPDVAASVPIRVKAGLAWNLGQRPDTWIGTEIEESIASSPALPNLTDLKLGLEQRLPDGFVARAGFTSESEQRIALGAGWNYEDFGFDAAVLRSDAGDYSERLEVSWSFAAPAAASAPTVSVAPLEIRYVPGTKKIEEAKIALNVPSNQNAEAWQLEIRDKNGNVIRIIEGIGTPPGSVNWDGRDKNGLWVNDGDQVTYRLSIKSPDNQTSFQPLISGNLNLPGSDLLPMDISNTEKQAALPALMPIFGSDGKAVDHFLIRMPENNAPLSQWSIEIKDSHGSTLQTIQGSGALPSELAWDGKTKEGMKISDPGGLNISLVTMDMNGKPTEIQGTVYTQAGLNLDWGEDQMVRLKIREAGEHSEVHAWAMEVVPGSLAPLAIPSPDLSSTIPSPAVPEPSATLTALEPSLSPTPSLGSPSPSASPSPTATAQASPEPSPTDTVAMTWIATATALVTEEPSPVPPTPTEMPSPTWTPDPTPRSFAPIHVQSQLSGERLAFVFMPAEEALVPSGPRHPLSPELLKRIHEAKIPQTLDIFPGESADEEKHLLGRLDDAYSHFRGLGFHLVRITGLLQYGEKGGYTLSRARAIRVSTLLNQRGYKGEFVIWVDSQPGAVKGVRIEVLH